MQILKIDPRALKGNPDDARRSKSSPQADALLLATVKAVGIIQPPIVSPETDGGNGLIIQAGHRRVTQAIEPTVIRNLTLLGPAAKANGSMATLGLSFPEFWEDLTENPLSVPSPYEKRRILMPEVNFPPMTDGIAALKEDYPAFKNTKVIEEWAGAISSTPDNMPYITEIPSHPGLLVGSGLEAGLSWGPAVGEALADVAMGNTPKFDLKNYRPDRFDDGTPLAFH